MQPRTRLVTDHAIHRHLEIIEMRADYGKEQLILADIIMINQRLRNRARRRYFRNGGSVKALSGKKPRRHLEDGSTFIIVIGGEWTSHDLASRSLID